MNYFQKVIICSDKNLSRCVWTQNGEDINIELFNNKFVLYRKFNSYANDDINLYFETYDDSYNMSFQIKNTYKYKIQIDLIYSEKNKFDLFLDGEKI